MHVLCFRLLYISGSIQDQFLFIYVIVGQNRIKAHLRQAEGRVSRSETRPEAASFSNWSPAGGPYVYSTQTGHLPEAPTCIHPEMYQAQILFTIYGRANRPYLYIFRVFFRVFFRVLFRVFFREKAIFRALSFQGFHGFLDTPGIHALKMRTKSRSL